MNERRYFGLHEMDRKLEKYLDFDNGYYVELGANDGINQSNTLYYEKFRNWRGVLIEPVPHNYLLCRANRAPENHIFCAACVSFDYKAEFVKMIYSNLMTVPVGLDSDLADPLGHAQSGKPFMETFEDVFVFGALARPLNELLVNAGAPRLIDFLSLDVEGAEFEVLKGVDHGRFRFRYIVIECRDLVRMSAYLAPLGYRYVENVQSGDHLFAAT